MMLTLESTLRGCLNAKDSTSLERLINDAADHGLLDSGGATILHEVRRLRNLISHQAVSFDVPPEAVSNWIGNPPRRRLPHYTRASNNGAA